MPRCIALVVDGSGAMQLHWRMLWTKVVRRMIQGLSSKDTEFLLFVFRGAPPEAGAPVVEYPSTSDVALLSEWLCSIVHCGGSSTYNAVTEGLCAASQALRKREDMERFCLLFTSSGHYVGVSCRLDPMGCFMEPHTSLDLVSAIANESICLSVITPRTQTSMARNVSELFDAGKIDHVKDQTVTLDGILLRIRGIDHVWKQIMEERKSEKQTHHVVWEGSFTFPGGSRTPLAYRLLAIAQTPRGEADLVCGRWASKLPLDIRPLPVDVVTHIVKSGAHYFSLALESAVVSEANKRFESSLRTGKASAFVEASPTHVLLVVGQGATLVGIVVSKEIFQREHLKRQAEEYNVLGASPPHLMIPKSSREEHTGGMPRVQSLQELHSPNVGKRS